MAIEGSLATFSITQLFNLVKLAKKSGVFHLYTTQGGTHLLELDFKDGMLVYALAKDKNSDIVHILRKYGKLNDKQAQSIQANRMGKTDKAVALLLLNGNFATQKDITHSTQQYILDIVLDVMTWREGYFIFDENAPPRTDRVTAALNLDDVLKLAAKRSNQNKTLEESIPNLDLPLRLANSRATTVQLSGKQWQVIGMISPQNTMRHIAHACHFTDTEMREIVSQLVAAHVVEIATDAR